MKLNSKLVIIEFDAKSKRLFSNKREETPSVRRLEEMSAVLFNQNFVNDKNGGSPLYYVFRNAGVRFNPTVFEAHSVRYDITVLSPYDLGGEFNKTLGHYHPLAEGLLGFPEIYEVIYGEAMFIMQKKMDGPKYDVRVIHGVKGDRVLVPPNYGHITVNVGKSDLIIANLVDSTFLSEYDEIKKMHGGCVYVLKNRNVVINQSYGNVSFVSEDAKKIESLDYSKSLYDEYVAHPEHFRFLSKPSVLFEDTAQWGSAEWGT
jgi:glucose-6-phosphate isomerase